MQAKRHDNDDQDSGEVTYRFQGLKQFSEELIGIDDRSEVSWSNDTTRSQKNQAETRDVIFAN